MRQSVIWYAVAVVLMAGGTPSGAWADPPKRVGGHVGFVVPLVSRSAGETATVADDFVIGFPMGIGIKKFGRVAIDMEVVPLLTNGRRDFGLELHPGVVFDVSPNLAAGVRGAFDAEGDAWGFTPLLNRTLYVAPSHSLFGEVVTPIRFVDAPGGHRTSVGLGVHVGIGF